ncbi:hypothetical protein Tco_1271027, partial [Tanacetum coccineum]
MTNSSEDIDLTKLVDTEEMIDYVMAKYENKCVVGDAMADVILDDLLQKAFNEPKLLKDDDTCLDIPIFAYTESSSDSYDCMSDGFSKVLMRFLVGRDLQWKFPKHTEEEFLKPLDVFFPKPKTTSTFRGTKTSGKRKFKVSTKKKETQPHYGLRSLGPKQEEVFVVKQPYSLVKMTNAVLGLRAPNAEVGCSSKKRNSLQYVVCSEMVNDMEVHFDMTVGQKVVFECLRAPHAQDFLLSIPIDGLSQHMSPVEYDIILKEHAVRYKELTGFKYRHNM